MALDKKTLNDFLPNGFETQNKEDYKVNFSEDKILQHVEELQYRYKIHKTYS